jgi:hypothetical protein
MTEGSTEIPDTHHDLSERSIDFEIARRRAAFRGSGRAMVRCDFGGHIRKQAPGVKGLPSRGGPGNLMLGMSVPEHAGLLHNKEAMFSRIKRRPLLNPSVVLYQDVLKLGGLFA